MKILDFGHHAVSIGVVAALLSGCGALSPSLPKGQDYVVHADRAVAQNASQHLYVADPGSGAIYRYAIVNGLPETSPDETFAKISGADFLGVDRNGRIYAGGNDEGGFVARFAPSGKLLATIQLGISVGAFAVDRDGFMYVSPGQSQAYTYSPKSFQSGGQAQPIATLTAQGSSDAFVALSVDANNRLFASANDGINVYDYPRKTSSQTATIALPARGWKPQFNGALAFDDSDRLYADIGFVDYCAGGKRRCHAYWWHLTDFDAIENGLSSRRRDGWTLAQNCYTEFNAPPGRYPGHVTGIAVFRGYIEAACNNSYASDAVVWVYHAHEFGQRQKAVEALGGLTAPTDAKVGP